MYSQDENATKIYTAVATNRAPTRHPRVEAESQPTTSKTERSQPFAGERLH